MTTIVDVHEAIERSGPRIMSARELAVLSLQRIGAFSVNDSSPDPVHLARALQWMDLGVQEFTGTGKSFWLVQRGIEIPLEAAKQEYDLQDAMGNALPPGNVIFPLSAMLDDGEGNETPVKIVDWEEFESIEKKSSTGVPFMICVDRMRPRMTMLVYYVPTSTTSILKLTVQQYAPDLTRNNGDTSHQMRAEFQLWLVMMTAKHIGKGPVKRLSLQVSNDIAQEEGTLRARLAAYANKEQPMRGQPERTESWGA